MFMTRNGRLRLLRPVLLLQHLWIVPIHAGIQYFGVKLIEQQTGSY